MQPDQSVRPKVNQDVVRCVVVRAPERAKARLVFVDPTLQGAVDVGQLAVREELNGGRSRKRWDWNEIGHGGKLDGDGVFACKVAFDSLAVGRGKRGRENEDFGYVSGVPTIVI